jgi:hypothetical protein
MPVKIAITGELVGLSRKTAIQLIESAGHVFADNVTLDTDYLVSTILTSRKVVDALRKGVSIITQAEFEDLLEIIDLVKVPKSQPRRIPAIVVFDWVNVDPTYPARVNYFDSDGVVTDRNVTIVATCERASKNGGVVSYFLARDHSGNGGQTKTFRMDRVLSLERI